MTLSGALERLWRWTPAGRAQAHDLAESAAARTGLTADATADPVIAAAEARLAALARWQEALERAVRLGERVRPWRR